MQPHGVLNCCIAHAEPPSHAASKSQFSCSGLDCLQVLPGTGIAMVNVNGSYSDQAMVASLANSEREFLRLPSFSLAAGCLA